ncbi:MAG: ABC transporter permease [Chlamydiae bacterium]|nr:ABC transporter permease [Chlamydiota bacterium]MBI3277971.1 ABC transporter permease [Chlamydiota bacterium]
MAQEISASSVSSIPKIIIRSSKGWVPIDWKALWDFRELLYFLTWRDIKVRYKQTVLGALWAIIQPFFSMVVFTIFFGKIARLPSDGVPYPIFSYSGLLLWTYFSGALSHSGASLVGSSNLLTKVYFPRLVIPLSATLSGLMDYAIAVVILLGMMFYYGFPPSVSFLMLPAIVFFSMIAATGWGLWLSALNVKYRDIQYALPFFIQLMLFATPVIYPASMVPEKYRWLLMLNPMSGLIEAHRACFLAHQPIHWGSLGISVAVAVIIFVGGLFYFRRTERFFADVV